MRAAACVCVVFVAVVMVACGGKVGLPGVTPSGPPVEVAAGDLRDAYSKDVAAADLKYLDKLVRVTGASGKVDKEGGKHFFGSAPTRSITPPSKLDGGAHDITVILRDNQERAANTQHEPGVLLYFEASQLADFQGVKPADKLTVEGVCRGTHKTPESNPPFVIVVEKCKRVR